MKKTPGGVTGEILELTHPLPTRLADGLGLDGTLGTQEALHSPLAWAAVTLESGGATRAPTDRTGPPIGSPVSGREAGD